MSSLLGQGPTYHKPISHKAQNDLQRTGDSPGKMPKKTKHCKKKLFQG
ncbi:MAG: hypothetical protein KBD30_02690 [Legionellaceae bacterium]|nr:hypothetical protein [Legionellaceae bacterium]